VVALGRGGALETVGRGAAPEALAAVARGGVAAVPGGVLFGEQSVDAIASALTLADRSAFDPDALAALAAPFSPGAFDRGFMAAFEAGRAARAGAASAHSS
jgi:hypothetical protein